MALHVDFNRKRLGIELDLDGEWHQLLPAVSPPAGTYILVVALLGAIDRDNEPDTNLGLKVVRHKADGSPDLVDNGTAWTTAILRDLVTATWSHAWPAKIVASPTYPAFSIWYRGRGGSADAEQQLLKFLRQRDS